MANELRRFTRPLDHDHLAAVLGGASWPSEAAPCGSSIKPLRDAVSELDSSLSGSEIDAALLEPLHRCLSGLTRREAADMRIWHMLAVKEFPELVWTRWTGGVPLPGTVTSVLTVSRAKRFIGQSSLNGVSRNTFARLWWIAESLRQDDDYSLAQQAISNQDMFQAIFERFFGIYPPAAEACLERFEPHSEGKRRRAAVWLQQCLSTTVLEALSREEIAEILDEAFAEDS